MKRIVRMMASTAMMFLLVGVTGCTSGNEPEENIVRTQRQSIELDANTRAVAETLKEFNARFTQDMVGKADEDAVDGNRVFSPLSFYMAVGMLANGVDDRVAQEIASYLGTNDLVSVNALSNKLLLELPKVDPLAKMSINNAVWVNNRHSLTDDFTSIINSSYIGSIQYDDFTKGEKVKNEINKWISKNTNNRFNNFIDKVDSGIAAILLNALYFQAPWFDEYFSADKTDKSVFHGSKGDTTVDMMHGNATTTVWSDDYFDSMSLSFGNSAYSLSIYQLKEGLSLDEANNHIAESYLAPVRLDGPDPNGKVFFLSIGLPKLDISKKYNILDMFKAAGLNSLTSELGFYMFKNPVSATLLGQQGAGVRWDEKGASAEAVTEEEILITSPGWESGNFTIDRPFYFFIKEVSTGACLISGRITDL